MVVVIQVETFESLFFMKLTVIIADVLICGKFAWNISKTWRVNMVAIG